MNQRGFATLEVILMVVVIGILASVAVPRFTDVTTKANTAKIQSDLTTIDTAIQMYNLETGKYPAAGDIPDDLKKYLMDIPTPPTGSAYIEGKSTDIGDTKTYAIVKDPNAKEGTDPMPTRGALNSNTAGKFYLPKS